jgi:hypothetical protein
MRSSGVKPLKWKNKTCGRILALAFLVTALASLPACGGGSSNPYASTSTSNPSGGVNLVAINITPSNLLIGLGEQRQLIATGVYNNGASIVITSQVTWAASSTGSSTNYVTVNSGGMATGVAIGAATVTATVGSVTGVLQLLTETNGFTTTTNGTLTVPFKSAFADALYLPVSQNQIQGAYAVQEINLDADQFSSVLPVPAAILATIPMPAGFVPNATVASQANFLVAVISYASPNVLIIDASNVSSDVSNNTVVSSFKSPVTQSVTINGITCMICGAVFNPPAGLLVLSTAEGYYTLDMVTGTFAAIPLTPAPAPAANFSLNPVASSPYILSTSPSTNEVQTLDLSTNAVTTDTGLGLTQPNGVAIDVELDYAAVSDAGANDQALLDVINPASPVVALLASNLSVCPGQTGGFNMVDIGVGASSEVAGVTHSLFLTETGGSCVGFEEWPFFRGDSSVFPGEVYYAYGTLPTAPDGSTFVNGNDHNAISTFNSVVDKHDYGVLIDANQSWIAKVNLQSTISDGIGANNYPLPTGFNLSPSLFTDLPGYTVTYLPTPASVVTLSNVNVNFGNQAAATSSGAILVTLTNTSTNALNPLDISAINFSGPNAGDYSQTNTCGTLPLAASTNCAIYITFTPSSTSPSSACLNIADNGGASPQTVNLYGNGATAGSCTTPSSSGKRRR